MDWSEFDDCFQKLRRVLRDIVGNGNLYKLDVYGNYIDYGEEIKYIVHRIETEVNEYVESDRKIVEMMRRNGLDEESLKVRVKYWQLLRLDIKSFFVFTRIFLDTLARIVKLHFGKGGEQLPPNMRDLVDNEALIKLDPDFARELKKKMSWMNDFVEHRVEFEHYLGGIPSTVTKDGKFGFSIRGLRIRGDSRTSTVESVVDYMREILSHLSEDIQFIYDISSAR